MRAVIDSNKDEPARSEYISTHFAEQFSCSFLPFAGVYRGKKAFRELIPRVAESLAVVKIKSVATTVGDDHAVEVVEFTFAGEDGVTVQNTEVIRFRGQQICEIRPFYHDPAPWIAAATRLDAARTPGSSTRSSS